MDSYLHIAEIVLRDSRCPLSSKAILEIAFKEDLAPYHLHGKTQHKTLQARLSEDILERRDHSKFFRTAPGLFFLREFLTDPSLPDEFRRPIATRRRMRELMRGPALAISEEYLSRAKKDNGIIEPDYVLNLLNNNNYEYEDPKNSNENLIFIWSFVYVSRNTNILGYRLGRYRDDRDSFKHHRTIGFSTLVHRDERTLFNMDNFGIIESGVKAAKIDLDMPPDSFMKEENSVDATLEKFLWITNSGPNRALLAVINFRCPDWFEPLRRRLSINDLGWLDLSTPPNNIEDFDPWSRCIISVHSQIMQSHEG